MAETGGMMADNQQCYMMDAPEVAAVLGCKIGLAYKIIRQCNEELEAMGKITIRGKVNRKYLESKLEI